MKKMMMIKETKEFDASATWNQHPYTRKLIPSEEGGYSAYVQELEGCIAEGDTADEALENLSRAAIAWIDAQHELGQVVPTPKDLTSFSGRIALRIPRGLHKQASELAQEERVSINQFLMNAIAFHVGQRTLLKELKHEVSKLKPAYTVIRLTESKKSIDASRPVFINRGLTANVEKFSQLTYENSNG